MSRSLRFLIPGGLLLVLVAVNASIWQKEHLISGGTRVSLPLAPVDPRSLMQGDYMALDWKLSRDLAGLRDADALPESGKVILGFVDGTTHAEMRRLDDGKPLGPDEVRLAYRVRQGQVRVATDAYFFQEGSAAAFERARYGELRVSPAGKAILVGLQDESLRPIVPGEAADRGS